MAVKVKQRRTPMVSRIVGNSVTTLGPFLTLLILPASSRSRSVCNTRHLRHASPSSAETARVATWVGSPQDAAGRRMRLSPDNKLGPFLTLILTLHCHRPAGRDGQPHLVIRKALFVAATRTAMTKFKLGSAITFLLAENAHPAGGNLALELPPVLKIDRLSAQPRGGGQ